MTKLHFNYKDLFRSFRLGFSAKKIWVGFVGLLFGWLGYAVLGYLGYWVSGVKIAQIWEAFRLVPMPQAAGLGFTAWGWVLWAVGFVWLVLVAMVAGMAISKLTYEQLRGDEFFEVREAWKQAFKSAGALIATPILLGLFVALLLAGGLLLGLVGRIPYAGEIMVGLLAVPAFAVALFVVYLVVVLLFTLTIGPAVIGTTRSDAFDNLFEVFSCVNDQPWRLVWYQFLLVIFALVGIAVLAFASVKALQLGRWIVGVSMNVADPKAAAQVMHKLSVMIDGAANYVRFHAPDWFNNLAYLLPSWVQNAFGWVKEAVNLKALVANTDISATLEASKPAASITMAIGTYLFAIAYHVLILVVLGYGMAIWFSGNTLIYLILVKKKDDRNLLEIRDEEIEIPEKLEAEPEEPAAKKPAKKPTRKTTTKAPAKKTTAKKTTRKKK